MTDEIQFTVAPKALDLAPGDTAEAVATLHNQGLSVEQFTLSIEGLDPGWYTLPVSSVSLFPNDHDKLQLIIHPPAAAHAKSASYPFRISIRSQDNPEKSSSEDMTLNIKSFPKFEMGISPQRIAGSKGIYKVLVNNTSEKDTIVYFQAGDTYGRLKYVLSSEKITVPGRGQAGITLKVKNSWLSCFNTEKEFDFEVHARLPEGQFAEESKTVTGQLVTVPWYRFFHFLSVPLVKNHWLGHPPIIDTFSSDTEDERHFLLNWVVKGATEVNLNDEPVDAEGEKPVHPYAPSKFILTAANKHGKTSRTIEVNPVQLPEATSSERIKVLMLPDHFKAQAGGIQIEASLQLQNLGNFVDKFLVEVKGLDANWYTRSASSVALMPQAATQVAIFLKPPKNREVRSGSYPFSVIVSSESNPKEATVVAAELEIQPAPEFKVAVHPYRVYCRRKGNFRVNLANTGVTDAFISLDASDLDAGVNFRFKNDSPNLIAWKTLEVPLVAKPKRGYFKGEQKRYDVRIQATTTDGYAQSMNAELYHRPFISSWRPVFNLVGILIVLCIIAVAGYLLLNMGGGFQTFTSGPQAWFYQVVRTVQGWSY